MLLGTPTVFAEERVQSFARTAANFQYVSMEFYFIPASAALCCTVFVTPAGSIILLVSAKRKSRMII